jgi:hypothetical protein
VPKSGGGKELTKQSPDEITVKCHINLNEEDKVKSLVTGALGKNALAIRSVHINPEDRIGPKANVVAVRKKICQSELEKIMSDLYDVETVVKGEEFSKINLDLRLYQMEAP